MEKIDGEGNVIGFSILKVISLNGRKPFSIKLKKYVSYDLSFSIIIIVNCMFVPNIKRIIKRMIRSYDPAFNCF